MNQNPEQRARDRIDKKLTEAGWIIQDRRSIKLHASTGVAVREYPMDSGGVADYVLFVEGKPAGIIEAKRAEEGHRLTSHEAQTEEYAAAKLKYLDNKPLTFLFESTGEIIRFTDYRDPKPRSREIFGFFRPESFLQWAKQSASLRGRVLQLPALPEEGLRDCQIIAINKLERSFKENRPRALIQMATGSGKTFTAITSIYRLLAHANAKRVLFLVDTKNLGEQAEQEFLAYKPVDDNRTFTELYNVQRLRSSFIATDSQVCISTIQRLYSTLKGEELDESSEQTNPGEIKWGKRDPLPVVYNARIPVEFFDFIVIDECHRSIYNLWQQVLEYFDAYLVGLTATPDNRTFGFFHQNIVSEYTHEQAVADGVNVGHNVYEIETEVTKKGAVVWRGEYVDHREKLTRKKRLEQLDEDVVYSNKQLDDKVVNPNQIRLIIKTFREHLPELFPDRFSSPSAGLDGEFEVPKTLIFAKTDSHADDIIQLVREEFAEENKFCKKITYNSEDPKGTLAQFRNEYHPRIAVTVDMIATGTDVKPLECLLFMRDVKSKNYFEQMKGRGTRVISLDDLRKVSPSAKVTKDHFVIVDAIGVTKSLKTDSYPMDKNPGIQLKDLLAAVAVGARDEELFITLASRLARLDRQISNKERENFKEKTNGASISDVAKSLLEAVNPDVLEEIRQRVEIENPDTPPPVKEEKYDQQVQALQNHVAAIFTGELNEYLENVRKSVYQVIDLGNADKLVLVGWNADNKIKSEEIIRNFSYWLKEKKNEITALQIFYDQPYRRREVTYSMIQNLLEKIKEEQPMLAPLHVWRAYEQLSKVKDNGTMKSELVALVSLVRYVCGIDTTLSPYDKTVDRNFQQWILKKNAGQHNRFTDEQMQWLRMIKDYVANSFHIDQDDFDLSPFIANGGLTKMWNLFGGQTNEIINELNEALSA